MAYPRRRADSAYALCAASGFVLRHYERPALVRLGVDVRRAARGSSRLDGTERSSVAGSAADVDHVCACVLAVAGAWNRIAGSDAALAAGAGGVEHSCICAAAHR